MDAWNYLEYGAWALSFIFGAYMLVDMARIESTYDNELLTSSREGELELTAERHEL